VEKTEGDINIQKAKVKKKSILVLASKKVGILGNYLSLGVCISFFLSIITIFVSVTRYTNPFLYTIKINKCHRYL
jgi:hypothetical protein